MFKNVNIKNILLFAIVAIILSNSFLYAIMQLKNHILETSVTWYLFLISLTFATGVFIAAVIAKNVQTKKQPAQFSFFGTSTLHALLMVALPAFLFIIFGGNTFKITQLLNNMLIILLLLTINWLNEYAWRGYLQNQLGSLKPVFKYLIVGSIYFIVSISSPWTELKLSFFAEIFAFSFICSFILGFIVDITKSLLASSSVVILISFLFGVNYLAFSLTEKIVIFSICIIYWIIVLYKWNKRNTELKQENI